MISSSLSLVPIYARLRDILSCCSVVGAFKRCREVSTGQQRSSVHSTCSRVLTIDVTSNRGQQTHRCRVVGCSVQWWGGGLKAARRSVIRNLSTFCDGFLFDENVSIRSTPHNATHGVTGAAAPPPATPAGLQSPPGRRSGRAPHTP